MALRRPRPIASPRTGFVALVAVSVVLSPVLAFSKPTDPEPSICSGLQTTTVSGDQVIRGSNRSEVLVGGPRSQRIFGNGGNDTICGGGGLDRIVGGSGGDRISGGGGSDSIYGGAGTDYLFGNGGSDRLEGDRGNDKLSGGAGQDFLQGQLGDDRLEGQAGGRDKLFGGQGFDLLDGGPGNSDVLRGDAGQDALDGGEGGHDLASFALAAPAAATRSGVGVYLGQGQSSGDGGDSLADIEDIAGSMFEDQLQGDENVNVIYGSGGSDVISGFGPDGDPGDQAI